VHTEDIEQVGGGDEIASADAEDPAGKLAAADKVVCEAASAAEDASGSLDGKGGGQRIQIGEEWCSTLG